MKSHYDKILLILGCLALAASAYLFLAQAPVVASDSGLLHRNPQGDPYEKIDPPKVGVASAVWDDPRAQDEAGLELYDIFTPPKIYWNPLEGQFSFEPPVAPAPPTPFGLQLVAIEREPFRIQLEAYFADNPAERSLVQFYNTQRRESIRGRVGDRFREHGFTIKSVQVVRVVDESGDSTQIRQVPTVVIIDHTQEDREITLTTDTRLFLEGRLIIRMQTVDPYPSERFTWNRVGDRHRTGDVTFTLREINFDKTSVTVEKMSYEGDDPETKTLVPSRAASSGTASPTPSPSPATAPSPEPDSGDLESLFQ